MVRGLAWALNNAKLIQESGMPQEPVRKHVVFFFEDEFSSG